jgi:hypothetical protein
MHHGILPKLTLAVSLLAGAALTTGAEGQQQAQDSTAGTPRAEKAAAVYQGELCVSKYNDLNRNGRRDPGEPLLPNWKIIIADATTRRPLADGVTNANGVVCFLLRGGQYAVEEVLERGWQNSDPGRPIMLVTVVNREVTNVAFGNYKLAEPAPPQRLRVN